MCYYNSKDVEKILNISSQTLAAYRKEGKIKFEKLGHKTIIYKKEDIDNFVNKDRPVTVTERLKELKEEQEKSKKLIEVLEEIKNFEWVYENGLHTKDWNVALKIHKIVFIDDNLDKLYEYLKSLKDKGSLYEKEKEHYTQMWEEKKELLQQQINEYSNRLNCEPKEVFNIINKNNVIQKAIDEKLDVYIEDLYDLSNFMNRRLEDNTLLLQDQLNLMFKNEQTNNDNNLENLYELSYSGAVDNLKKTLFDVVKNKESQLFQTTQQVNDFCGIYEKIVEETLEKMFDNLYNQ